MRRDADFEWFWFVQQISWRRIFRKCPRTKPKIMFWGALIWIFFFLGPNELRHKNLQKTTGEFLKILSPFPSARLVLGHARVYLYHWDKVKNRSKIVSTNSNFTLWRFRWASQVKFYFLTLPIVFFLINFIP